VTHEHPPDRRIRSFVMRQGRTTPAQQRAFDAHWARFGLEYTGAPRDLDAAFGRAAPKIVEIGFGNGESLLALAAAHPDRDYVGIEVHRPGIGHLMLRAEELGLGNVRAICRDAVEVLQQCVAAGSLDELLLYFPDPWPKKRHHRRRLITGAFAEALASRVTLGGFWHIATDWPDYALAMEDAIAPVSLWEGGVIARPESRPLTRYERRGLAAGREPVDLWFERVAP